MNIQFKLSLAKLTAKGRLPGYLEEILAVGRVDGDSVSLTMEQYRDIAQRYTPPFLGGGASPIKRNPFPFRGDIKG